MCQHVLIVVILRSPNVLYRKSYMSAPVLLNLLKELGKRDKMRGLPSILSLFLNEFNKFNHTGATNVRFCLSYDKYFEISFLPYKRYNWVIMYSTLLWTS